MISVSQIQEIVSRYLSSGDAEKFILEFSAASLNIHKSGDPRAIDLANKIESKRADLHAALISKDSFNKFLRDMLAPPQPYLISTPVATSSMSAMFQSNRLDWAVDLWGASSIQFGDKQLASECKS